MGLVLPKYGDRILLRDFVREDAEPLADIEYDADVKKYLALPARDRSEWIRSFSPDLVSGCAFEALPEHVLAGRASISRTSTPGKGELQIVIAKRFWGQHLGRKAAAILIPAAFEELHAAAIVALVHPDNRAGLKLLESWGFAYCGKKESNADDWQHGHLIFELSRSAYHYSLQGTRRQATPPELGC